MKNLILLAALLLVHPALGADPQPFPWSQPVFPAGPSVGQPIDDSMARPVVILTPEQSARYGGDQSDLFFANYSHKGKFHIARVPRDAVSQVILQKVCFNAFKGAIQHMQVELVLKPGKELSLYDQDDMSRVEPVVTGLGSLTYSSEAVADEQKNATDINRQADGRVVLIRRMLSPIDNYAYLVATAGNPIIERPLDTLNDEQRQALLHDLLRQSHEDGYSRLYNWFHTNCVTDCWRAVDEASETELFGRLFSHLPYTMGLYLKLKGMMPEEGFSPLSSFRERHPEVLTDRWVREVRKAWVAATKQDRDRAKRERAARAETEPKNPVQRGLLKGLSVVKTVGQACGPIAKHLLNQVK